VQGQQLGADTVDVDAMQPAEGRGRAKAHTLRFAAAATATAAPDGLLCVNGMRVRTTTANTVAIEGAGSTIILTIITISISVGVELILQRCLVRKSSMYDLA
jgi:hypothetical protein